MEDPLSGPVRDRRVMTSLSEEEHRALNAEAARRGTTQAALLRELVLDRIPDWHERREADAKRRSR